MLDNHGLKAPSTHVGTETLDNVDAFVDEAKILGHKYLVLADVPSEGRQSLASFAARKLLPIPPAPASQSTPAAQPLTVALALSNSSLRPTRATRSHSTMSDDYTSAGR